MALVRSTTHTQAADGTFSADGATYWNAAHTNAITGAVSGGVPYFDSTTTEATSALLAQYSPVLGGGAGAAPYTDSGFTATGTGATFVATLNGLTVTAAPTFSALTVTRIPFAGTAGLLGDSASLTYSDTLVASKAGLKVGTTGTNTGLTIGYGSISGYGALWSNAVTPGADNMAFLLGANDTSIVGGGSSTGGVYIVPNASVTKQRWLTTAGLGTEIFAGTAASAVSAESITQTWNFNTSAITGVKWTFTDTSSHANTLAFQILGGASGTTNLIKVSKAGLVDAPAYSVAGSAGADFGPGVVTSITVVKGIITAIS